MMKIIKNDKKILTLDEWRELAPPKSGIHWQDGHSAKELARYWVDNSQLGFPAEIQTLLSTSDDFLKVKAWQAEPEVKLSFDTFGEPRNSDLLISAEDDFGPFLIAVEGKADEPFDRDLRNRKKAALAARDKNPNSKALDRLELLIERLFARKAKPIDTELNKLRYQLLTATAGLLAEANRQGVGRVVLLIQEFVTDKTLDRKHKMNAKDLDNFTRVISRDEVKLISPGVLSSAILLTDSKKEWSAKLYVGKVTHYLR